MSQIRFMIIGVLLSFPLLLGNAFAKEAPLVAPKPLKLAVLDFAYVIQNAVVSSFIQESADSHRALLQKDVEGFEKELRKEEAALQELRNKNDPDFEEAKIAFENKVTDVQKQLSGRTKIIKAAFNEARSKVSDKIMSLVAIVSARDGITLVIPKGVVMYQEKGYEITERILKELDKEMPRIEIKLPKGV